MGLFAKATNSMASIAAAEELRYLDSHPLPRSDFNYTRLVWMLVKTQVREPFRQEDIGAVVNQDLARRGFRQMTQDKIDSYFFNLQSAGILQPTRDGFYVIPSMWQPSQLLLL